MERNTLDVVPWPFLKYGQFVLCVIRQNQPATILGDSLGTAPTSRFIEEVQNRLNATTRFKGWHVSAGHSAQQENYTDCGIFCIAKAAYISTERGPPPKINALFWRVACRTAIGLHDTAYPEHLAHSKVFANLQGCPERGNVQAAVSQIADDDGSQVLQDICKANQGSSRSKQWFALVDGLVERMKQYEAQTTQGGDGALTARTDSASGSGIWTVVQDIKKFEEYAGTSRRNFILETERSRRLEAMVSRMQNMDDVVAVILASES